jgi:hypothetical protein
MNTTTKVILAMIRPANRKQTLLMPMPWFTTGKAYTIAKLAVYCANPERAMALLFVPMLKISLGYTHAIAPQPTPNPN